MDKVDEIKRAYRTAARIVAVLGNAYLPIFDRLQQEVQRLQNEESLLKIALNVASNAQPKERKN